MRGTINCVFGFAACLLWGIAPVWAGGIPAKTLKDVKAASVYIKVQFGLPVPGSKTIGGTGSGFLIRAEGDTGFFVTNHHVLTPPKEIPGLVRVGPVVLVFNSGNLKEKLVNAEIVASDPVRDLAILKVVGFKDLPTPIGIDPKVELLETMTVYAFGYPFGGALATGKLNPAISVSKGTISSLRNDDQGNIRLVQIDADINPGNSGGAVVDEKGNLIGVAVSKIDKSRIGFAIPTRPLAEMLIGKVAQVAFETIKVDGDKAEVQIDASLLDPLAKLRGVTVYYRPKAPGKEAPKPDMDGNYPLLKDAKKIELKIENGKAGGKFSFPATGKEKKKEPLTYQAVYVNGDGKTIVSGPATAFVDFTQVVFQEKLTAADPIDRVRNQPSRVFPVRLLRGKHYVIEMRGDPKVLDPYLRIEDSRGGNIAEDGDSGGVLNSMIVFTPNRDDEFKIIATVLRGTGDFTLRIREEEGKPVPPKGLVMNGKLDASDPLDPLLQAPAQNYNFLFKRGVLYTIDMKSKDFDTFLRLENMAGLNIAADDDSGGQLNSRISFTPAQDGIFRVIATSFDRNTGGFELRITEGGSLEVGPGGLRIAGALIATDPLDPVLGKMGNSRSKFFEVKMEPGQRYQIDLVSDKFDAFLRVEDATGRQIAFDDDSGGGLNSRLVFTPPAAGVYRVYAAALDANLGPFVLLIRTVK